MSDLVLHSGIGASIGAGISQLWQFFVQRSDRRAAEAREKRQSDECKERIKALDERVVKIEQRHDDCEERWRREVERGARLAQMPATASPPAPDWEESSAVRHARAQIEQAALKPLLEVHAGHKVLVIDDEQYVGNTIRRILTQVLPSTWEVRYETDPRRGLATLMVARDIGIAFIDVQMPGLDGEELISRLLQARPELRGRIVVCSGLVLTPAQERHMFDALGCRRLDKPFSVPPCEALIREMLGPLPIRARSPSRPGGE